MRPKREPDEFLREFSSKLRQFVFDSGYTQDHIARLIGVSGSTVCQYVNGNRMPNLRRLRAICNILGVSLEDVVPKEIPEVSVVLENQTTIYDVIGE